MVLLRGKLPHGCSVRYLQEYPRALAALLAEIRQTGGTPEAHQRMQQLIAEGGRLRGSIAGKLHTMQPAI